LEPVSHGTETGKLRPCLYRCPPRFWAGNRGHAHQKPYKYGLRLHSGSQTCTVHFVWNYVLGVLGNIAELLQLNWTTTTGQRQQIYNTSEQRLQLTSGLVPNRTEQLVTSVDSDSWTFTSCVAGPTLPPWVMVFLPTRETSHLMVQEM